MKRVSLLEGAVLLAAIFVAHPQQAHAATVTAVLCTVATFPCPALNTIDSGFRDNNIGLLFANRYTLLPFVFDDASANFTGTMFALDSQGKFVYLWAGGVGTSKLALAAPLWLDVQLSQTYVTVPGAWSFFEFNSGSCNAAATAAADNVLATLAINGATPLPVMNGVCSPFAVTGGPVGVGLGAITTLTGLAQFKFNPGAANQRVDLPWGENFPDPAITVFPDPDHIPAGFIEQTPEPAAWLLMGGGLLAVGLVRRRVR